MARNPNLERTVVLGSDLGEMKGACGSHTPNAIAVVAWKNALPEDCTDNTLAAICDGYEPKAGGVPRAAIQHISLGETLKGVDLDTEAGHKQCAEISRCALATWCLNNCANAIPAALESQNPEL